MKWQKYEVEEEEEEERIEMKLLEDEFHNSVVAHYKLIMGI